MTDSDFGPLIETRMRVVSWNLWWRFGDYAQRQHAIVETLKKLDPDLVALQEIWQSGSDDQAAALADALGMHPVYAHGLQRDGHRFGNAILSRWPITGSDHRSLSALDEQDDKRLVLRADIEGPRGPLQLFTTHLNWRFDHSHVRQAQVRELLQFVKDSPARRYPPVVCGDFNAAPDSDEVRMMTGRTTLPVPGLVFHDAWDAAGEGPGHTWDRANPLAARALEPNRRIDYIFAGWPKAGGAGQVTAASLSGVAPIDGVQPSDHFGVQAQLRY